MREQKLDGSIVETRAKIEKCRRLMAEYVSRDSVRNTVVYLATPARREEIARTLAGIFKISPAAVNQWRIWRLIWASEHALIIKEKHLCVGLEVLARTNKARAVIEEIRFDYQLKIRYLGDPKRKQRTSVIAPEEVEIARPVYRIGGLTLRERIENQFTGVRC